MNELKKKCTYNIIIGKNYKRGFFFFGFLYITYLEEKEEKVLTKIRFFLFLYEEDPDCSD